jgi:tetratricopeptide (TPR) repeat protein
MRSLDWRAASWLEPLAGVVEHQRNQHELALGILERHEQAGSPFALFLRTYGASQLYVDGPDGDPTSKLENLLWDHLNARGIGLIAVQDRADPLNDVSSLSAFWFKQTAPALQLTDAGWFEAVREMMARAELIVAECQFLTPGLEQELKALIEARRAERTVLLLPVSPPFESLDDRPTIAPFVRAIHADAVNWKSPFDRFPFSDLISRLTAISELDAGERLALLRADGLDSRFPISPGDALMGLEELAADHRKAGRRAQAAFCYSRLVQIARQAGSHRFTAGYLASLAPGRFAIGDFKGGLDWVLEAESLLKSEAAGDREKPAVDDGVLTLESIGKWKKDIVLKPAEGFLARNQSKETIELLTEFLEPIRKWQDRPLEALCLSKWAEAEIRDHRCEDALHTIARVIELAQQSGDGFREAYGIYLQGTAYLVLKDEQRAAAAFTTALDTLPRPGAYEVEWAIFMNLGTIAEARGDRENAVKLYAAAEAAATILPIADHLDIARNSLKRLEAG